MDLTLAVGLVVAALAWAALFAPGRERLWWRALPAGLAIGLFGAVAQRHQWRRLLAGSPREAALGLVGAVALYAVFLVGDRTVQRVVPRLARQVDELYAVRADASTVAIAAVVGVVGTCEELFWRGFVQDRAGFLLALAAYAVVHVWERKVMLVLAAAGAGAFWGGLVAWRGTLDAAVVSHVVWDLLMVVWLPLRRPDGLQPPRQRAG